MTMNERREETGKVKAALKAAGIEAEVKHGTGTAWGWLKVNIGPQPHRFDNCAGNCADCEAQRTHFARVRQIVRDVTGRVGEYNGNVAILSQ